MPVERREQVTNIEIVRVMGNRRNSMVAMGGGSLQRVARAG